MTCKDCLHYDVCEAVRGRPNLVGKNSLRVAEKHCPYNSFTAISEWVHLPCKVGDTIYFDTYKRGENIGVQPHKVGKVVVIVSTTRKFGCVGADIPDWEFGKTVFLTREEAEKALKDMRKEDEGK